LFPKVLSNLCSNLWSSHLVDRFDTDYASTEAFAGETFFELSLCLARTKEQDGFCVADVRDHLVIVFIEVGRELSVSLIVCRALFRSVATREPDMFFDAGLYSCRFFSLVSERDNKRLPVINPQAHLSFHGHETVLRASR